jgi:hypothetical protein
MQTALHPILSNSGAQFREIAGWDVPESFGNVEAEYWALRRAAAIADLSPRAKLAVTGGDRVLFLHLHPDRRGTSRWAISATSLPSRASRSAPKAFRWKSALFPSRGAERTKWDEHTAFRTVTTAPSFVMTTDHRFRDFLKEPRSESIFF